MSDSIHPADAGFVLPAIEHYPAAIERLENTRTDHLRERVILQAKVKEMRGAPADFDRETFLLLLERSPDYRELQERIEILEHEAQKVRHRIERLEREFQVLLTRERTHRP